jgi:hypothetical protein
MLARLLPQSVPFSEIRRLLTKEYPETALSTHGTVSLLWQRSLAQ